MCFSHLRAAILSSRYDEPRLRRIFGLGNPSAGKAGLQQLAIRPEERVGPVELPDRHLMRDQAAKTFTGKPGVQVKSRWLDPEGRFTQLRKIQIDRMVRCGTNRG